LFVLEENDIQNHVRLEIAIPEEEDERVKYRKNEGKAKRIIIDSMKDHLISHISEQENQEDVRCLGQIIREQ